MGVSPRWTRQIYFSSGAASPARRLQILRRRVHLGEVPQRGGGVHLGEVPQRGGVVILRRRVHLGEVPQRGGGVHLGEVPQRGGGVVVMRVILAKKCRKMH
jgi:hypothetical protein